MYIKSTYGAKQIKFSKWVSILFIFQQSSDGRDDENRGSPTSSDRVWHHEDDRRGGDQLYLLNFIVCRVTVRTPFAYELSNFSADMLILANL